METHLDNVNSIDINSSHTNTNIDHDINHSHKTQNGPSLYEIQNMNQPVQIFDKKKEIVNHDFTMKIVKFIDIGFITSMYFILGLYTALLLDRFYGTFDPKEYDKKSLSRCIFEIIAHIWLTGVLTYFARNVVPLIPFPLDGYDGFVHKNVKELFSAAAFGTALSMFQVYLNAKIKYVENRVNLQYD